MYWGLRGYTTVLCMAAQEEPETLRCIIRHRLAFWATCIVTFLLQEATDYSDSKDGLGKSQ